MEYKIRISNIMLFLLYHLAFIRIYYFVSYDYIRYFCIVIIGLFLIAYQYFIKKEIIINDLDQNNKGFNVLLMLFLVSICISSYLSKDTHVLISALIYAAEIFEVFAVFQYFASRKRCNDAVYILYNLTFFYLILTDVLMFIAPSLFKATSNYLTGDKFSISYLHLLLLVLYVQKIRLRERWGLSKGWMMLVLFGWAFFIISYVDCKTALVGWAFLVILLVLPEKVKRFFCNPFAAVVVLLVSDSVLILYSSILSNPYVTYFITNILHKDLTLTGRTTIYSTVFEVIKQRNIWGYGYNQAYTILTNQISSVNAQNGILNNAMSYGWVGVVLLILLLFFTMQKMHGNLKYYPLAVMLYIYIFISSVEITLDIKFLCSMAILFACSASSNEKTLETVDKRT